MVILSLCCESGKELWGNLNELLVAASLLCVVCVSLETLCIGFKIQVLISRGKR